MNGKPVFTEADLSTIKSLIEAPDFSSVNLRENKNYSDYALYLLKKFNVKLKKENLEKFGRFVARCVKANRKNIRPLSEAADVIFKRKLVVEALHQRMHQGVKKIKHLMEQDKIEQEASFEKLSPEAQKWRGHINLLDMKSFKVAWYDRVKDRSDIVYTDEDEYKSRIKICINKPLFQVPETTLEGFVKHRFDQFPAGFYEYIEYMMYLIEAQLRNKDKADGSQNQVLDRTIFLVTDAVSMNNVDPNKNLVAINTYGHDRPTYKGLPEFLKPDDIKRMQAQQQNSPAQQQAGPSDQAAVQ